MHILQIIKIENFKSYEKINFIGPLNLFSGVFGKNGSGKTNFSDAIAFGLGANLNDIECFTIQNLFHEPFLGKNLSKESKIGIKVRKKKKYTNFFRITDNHNISEFFVDGLKVSSKFYRNTLKKLKIGVFYLLSLFRNVINNKFFGNNSVLTRIIDDFSGSKKLSNVHIKIGFLRKKLQKSSIYFFQKLRLLEKEKIKRETNRAIKAISLKLLKKKLKKKNYIILAIQFKLWNQMKINNEGKCFFYNREIFFHEYLVNSSFFFTKSVSKIEKKKKENRLAIGRKCTSYLKIFQKLLLLLNLNEKKVLIKEFLNIFDKEFFFSLQKKVGKIEQKKNKIIPSGKKKKFTENIRKTNFFCSQDKKEKFVNGIFSFNSNLAKKFKFFHKKLKIYHKRITLQKESNLIFYNILMKKLSYEKKKLLCTFLIQKYYNLVFFSTIILLFILLQKKEKTEEKTIIPEKMKKDDINFLLNTKKGIRGNIESLIKPIDSIYKKKLEFLPHEKEKTLLIDNFRTGMNSLLFLEKFRRSSINFFSIEGLIEYSDNFRKFLFFFDFDEYDVKVFLFFMQKFVSSKEREEKNVLKIGKNYFKKNKDNLLFISFEKKQKKKKKKEKNFFVLKNKKNFLLEFLSKITSNKKYQEDILIKLSNLTKENILTFVGFVKKISIFSIIFLKKTKFSFFIVKNLSHKIGRNFFFRFFLFTYAFELNIYGKIKIIQKKERKNLTFLSISLIFDFSNIGFMKKQDFLENLSEPKFIQKRKNKQKRIKFFFLARLLLKKEFFLLARFSRKMAPDNFMKKHQLICKERDKDNTINFFSNTNFALKFIGERERERKKELAQKKILFKNLLQKFYFFFEMEKFFLECENVNSKKISSLGLELLDLGFFCYTKNCSNNKTFKVSKLLVNYAKKYEKRKKFFKIFNERKKNFFIQKKFEFFKKKLIESRFRFLVANNKFIRISEERIKRFKFYSDRLSAKINQIYKELTKTTLNPGGGTAFLTFENSKKPFLGSISLILIPPAKSYTGNMNLSGGEKACGLISLSLSFCAVFDQNFVLFDEAEAHLDDWHSEKFFYYLKNLSFTRKIQICIITLKIRFLVLFDTLIFLNRGILGTRLISIL